MKRNFDLTFTFTQEEVKNILVGACGLPDDVEGVDLFSHSIPSEIKLRFKYNSHPTSLKDNKEGAYSPWIDDRYNENQREEVLNMPFEVEFITARGATAIREYLGESATLRDLINTPKTKLLELKDIGVNVVKRIEKGLERFYGLKLKDE